MSRSPLASLGCKMPPTRSALFICGRVVRTRPFSRSSSSRRPVYGSVNCRSVCASYCGRASDVRFSFEANDIVSKVMSFGAPTAIKLP